MKRLLLLAALLPAAAFAQQAPNRVNPGNWYPSSCTTNYAMNQMLNLAQLSIGDPHSDRLKGMDVISQVTAPTDAGYACKVSMQWRDHGELDGTLTLTNNGSRVLLHFTEDVASTKKNERELAVEDEARRNEFPTRCNDLIPKLQSFMQLKVGDRIGRTIVDVERAYPIHVGSFNTLSCVVNVIWKNGDVTQGMVTLIKLNNEGGVDFTWTPNANGVVVTRP